MFDIFSRKGKTLDDDCQGDSQGLWSLSCVSSSALKQKRDRSFRTQSKGKEVWQCPGCVIHDMEDARLEQDEPIGSRPSKATFNTIAIV